MWRPNWSIKSSTESEWVDADGPSLQGAPRHYGDAHFEVCGKEFVDNRVSTILWTRDFLLEQGYAIREELLLDNTSTILVEQNGKTPSWKNTRYVNG